MPSLRTIVSTLFLFFLSLWTVHGATDLVRCEVRLIWGTNDGDPPQKSFKLIDTSLTQKLSTTLAWKTYYEVKKQEVQMRKGDARPLELSKVFSVTLEYLKNGRLEAKLFNAGRFFNRTVVQAKTGNRLVLAYDGENQGAWFVVVKILEPV
jgi:hypothetical protein